MIELIHEFLFLIGRLIDGQLNLAYHFILEERIDQYVTSRQLQTVLDPDDLEYVKVVHFAHCDQEFKDSYDLVLLGCELASEQVPNLES